MKYFWLLFLALLPTFLLSNEGEKVTKINPESEVKERMMNWSRQLGVTCVYCHNLDNFKDPIKPAFKVADQHQKMVRVLQEEVFHDRDKGNVLKVKVDCYMCHRGKQLPDYQEPPNFLTK